MVMACLGLALGACGEASLSATRPAPHEDVETRVLRPKRERELPRLIAPPPAYGDKIVLARGTPVRASN